MRKRLILGIASMGYSKAVVAIMQIAMVPVLANSWGLHLYGQWLVLAAIPMFLGASDLGFAVAASNRFIAEVARDEIGEARTTFQSTLVMLAACSAIVLTIALVCCLFLPQRVFMVDDGMTASAARLVLGLLCAYAALTLFFPLLNGVSRSVGKFALSTSIVATGQLFEGLAIIVVALTGGQPAGAAAAMLTVRVITTIILAFAVKKHASWVSFDWRCATMRRLKELFRPAVAVMVLPLAQAGFLQGTAIAVGAAGSLAMVPIYTALRTISRIGLQFASALAIPLMPEFTIARAQGNHRLAARIGGALAAAAALIAMAMALVVGFLGPEILDLWTGGSIEAPRLMITIFAIEIIFSIMWAPLSDLLLAINKHETYSYAYLACAALTVALTFMFVGRFGVTGAAGANLVLDIIMFAVVAMSLCRHVGRLELDLSSLRAMLPRSGINSR